MQTVIRFDEVLSQKASKHKLAEEARNLYQYVDEMVANTNSKLAELHEINQEQDSNFTNFSSVLQKNV